MPIKSILRSQRYQDRIIPCRVSVMKHHDHRNLFLRSQVVYLHEMKPYEAISLDKRRKFIKEKIPYIEERIELFVTREYQQKRKLGIIQSL